MAEQALDHMRQVQLLFDAKAGSWAAKYAPDGRLARRLTRLADAIGYHVPTAGRVLDLGCGTGELARHLAGAGLRVTGCDISANILGQAAAADPGGAAEWIRLDPEDCGAFTRSPVWVPAARWPRRKPHDGHNARYDTSQRKAGQS